MFGCFKRMRRLIDLELSEQGMSLSRSKILSEISRNGPQNQRSLATTFSLAPRTVTEMVDTLERDGLVERRADPGDRRARHVYLTPAGEQARIHAVAARERLVQQVLGPLSDQQRDALFTALQHVEIELDKIDAGDAKGGAFDPFCPPVT